MSRCVLLLILGLFSLFACSTVPRQSAERPEITQAYNARYEVLRELESWSLNGRLAISDGAEGGSGRLSWIQQDRVTELAFRGALGKGAWQLHADSQGARLELANGQIHQAETVSQLVIDHIGWKVPVDALSWWVKGLAYPDKWASRTLDELGRLTRLQQFDWDVEISKYQQQESTWMPSRLTARRGDYSVKMVVKDWQISKE